MKTDKEILAFLAGGYALRYDGNSTDCALTHFVEIVPQETISRLLKAGWLESFANAGGYRISDEGKKTYMRSTDELAAHDALNSQLAEVTQDEYDCAHDAFHDVYQGDNFDASLKRAIAAAFVERDSSEPTKAMLDAARDCTPVTKDAPDPQITARSIYVCMTAARKLAAYGALNSQLIDAHRLPTGRYRKTATSSVEEHLGQFGAEFVEGSIPAGCEPDVEAEQQAQPSGTRRVMDGVSLIRRERLRQITQEGYTIAHDDQHNHEELVRAAACYATPTGLRAHGVRGCPSMWPWDTKWWKPTPDDRIRELAKAGALIAAEIDWQFRHGVKS